MAFEERGTTEGEARRASRRLQQLAPEAGLLPEQHLPRLLRILRKIQAPRLAAQERARRIARRVAIEKAEAEEDHVRQSWSMLPDFFREDYRRQVRAVCGAVRRFPLLIERIARDCWAQECMPGRGEPGSILTTWAGLSPDGPEVQASGSPGASRAQFRPSDPAPEPTPEAVRRGLESRRDQLARLGATITTQAVAS